MARQAQDEIDKEMRNYRLQQRQVAIAGANSRREQERHEYEMRERDAKWTAVAMKGLNDFNRNVAILQGKVKPDPYEGLDPETAAKMKRDDYIRNTETTAKSPALRDKAGNQVQFRDKDERKTFEEYHDASAIVIGNLNRILELRKNMSTWEKTQPAKFSEAQAEINSLLGQTLPLYNANIDRLGAMDKGVQEIFEKQAGDPTSVFDAKAVTPITTMRDRLRDRYRKKAETAVPELDLSQQEFLHDSPTSAIGESARVTVAGLDSPDAGTALGSLRSISTVMGDNPSLSGDPTFRKNLDKAIKTVEKSGTPEQKKELVQRKGEIENVEDTRQRLIIKQAMEDNPGHFWPLMGPNLGLLVEGDHPSIRPKRKKLVEAIERGKLKSGNIYDILGEGGIFQPE
jgi:hypothetical protein